MSLERTRTAWMSAAVTCLAITAAAPTTGLSQEGDLSAATRPETIGLTGLEAGTAEVNGTTLYYVRGGSGPSVILLHGFPQDWTEWDRVIPELTDRFTVVAVDLRGVGGSAPTEGGYDAMTLAGDIRALAAELGLDRPYVVGHDIGGMVAYAYARRFPQATRGVMVLDVPLPGIGPWEEIRREPSLWHFHFHQAPALPESLVAGREAVYFRDFLTRIGGDPALFSDEDIARWARAHRPRDKLRAAFGFYRAFPAIAEWNAARVGPLDVPIVLAGGDRATAAVLPAVAADLRAKGASDVQVIVIEDSGHYVVDEQPASVAALIATHAGG